MIFDSDISKDPSQEVVLGLLESLQLCEMRHDTERMFFRAIIRRAIARRALVLLGGKFVGQRAAFDHFCGFQFTDARTAGKFSHFTRGRFIKFNDNAIWKICRNKRVGFYFSDGSSFYSAQDLIKQVSFWWGIKPGELLWSEYCTNYARWSALFPVASALMDAANATPSATLVPFGILARNADSELLGIARLLFAIKILANQKEKNDRKHEKSKSDK
jgi:hypothetical protein